MDGYEWSRSKATENRWKHDVDFADGATVFGDEQAVTIEDEGAEERRFVTLGVSAEGQVLVVAYTWRATKIRIISARRATPRERKAYDTSERSRHARGIRLQPRRARGGGAARTRKDPDHDSSG
ncbi:MAG: BrnT family toxin [Acidobacteria bacterium]|nr:BrnT family toxin [Acidobacteriota bacterium]